MLYEVGGDLTEFSKAEYIAHQCNCISTNAAGLAYHIFRKYPYADAYKNRKARSEAGTIEVCVGNDESSKKVINLFAQYYPGNARYVTDSEEKRIEWMKQCLFQVYKLRDEIKSIAFPFGMGCGLGGGDWKVYKGLIEKLAKNMPNTEVYIVKKFEKDIEISESRKLGKNVFGSYDNPAKLECSIAENYPTHLQNPEVSENGRLLGWNASHPLMEYGEVNANGRSYGIQIDSEDVAESYPPYPENLSPLMDYNEARELLMDSNRNANGRQWPVPITQYNEGSVIGTNWTFAGRETFDPELFPPYNNQGSR